MRLIIGAVGALGLIGCANRAPAETGPAVERMIVERAPLEPPLCLSTIPDAGRLKGAEGPWRAAAEKLRDGQLDAAVADIASAPDHPAVSAMKGAMALLADRPSDARAIYRQLSQSYPEDACVQQTTAAIYMASRDPRMARTYAKDAWRLDPSEPAILYTYALTVAVDGDPQQAISLLREIRTLDPDHAGASYGLGQVALANNQLQTAIPLLETAEASGIDVSRDLIRAYFQIKDMGAYLQRASAAGLPLGDEGALAEADDPMATWRGVLGLEDGQQTLIATVQTTLGDIHCGLLWEEVPVTVGNFVGLSRGTIDWRDPATGEEKADSPLYDGTQFHRVIPGFMIQGGDPLGTGTGGPGYRFIDEIRPERKFEGPGVLAMANAGPASNGSQFFITDGPATHLNGKHTIFGFCDEADLQTVAQIARVPRGQGDRPTEPVTIQSIQISAAP
ncbi:MAG: peptidylprolyl isomerase [Myxococcota bacterium]